MELGDCRCPLCCCCCSVAQLCPTLYDPMDCSTPTFPILHHLPELAQTHVHWVGGAIQPSRSLSSPSPLWEVPKYCATPQITDPRVFPPSFYWLQGSFHETINEDWERGVNIAAVHGTLAISLCLQGGSSLILYMPLQSGSEALPCMSSYDLLGQTHPVHDE